MIKGPMIGSALKKKNLSKILVNLYEKAFIMKDVRRKIHEIWTDSLNK